jgi:hypothetical protein
MGAISTCICIRGRKRCARVFQKSNLPGRPGTDKGRNQSEKHGILWAGSVQHAHLPTIFYAAFACKRLIRPFRAVEWMTISV